MNCTEIFVGEVTTKEGEVVSKVFAKFSDGSELTMVGSVEENKEKITGFKAAGQDPKGQVIVREGAYGKYAAFSQVTSRVSLA